MKANFIGDNDNVLLKMEISGTGTLNVKYIIIFDGFLLQAHISQFLKKPA